MEDLLNDSSFSKTATLISRYDTSLTNQLTKLLKELARLQHARLNQSATSCPVQTERPGLPPPAPQAEAPSAPAQGVT
jgi:hypothetical protein